MANLPVGYRFKPTKTQLVDFLKTKLSEKPLPRCYSQILVDFDVYNDHPFDVLALTKKSRGVVNDGEDGMYEGYFFSHLKKSGERRFTRCIQGIGTWSEKCKTKKVYDKTMSYVIGFEKYFKFKPVDGVSNEHEWMMHEYSLRDDGNNEVVLCHITKKHGSSKIDFGRDYSRPDKRNLTYDIGHDGHDAGPSNNNKRVCVQFGSSSDQDATDLMSQGITDHHGLDKATLSTTNETLADDLISMISFDDVTEDNNNTCYYDHQQFDPVLAPYYCYEQVPNRQEYFFDDDFEVPQQQEYISYYNVLQVSQQIYQDHGEQAAAALYMANGAQLDTIKFDHSATTGDGVSDESDPFAAVIRRSELQELS